MSKNKKGPKTLLPDSVADSKNKPSTTVLTPIEQKVLGFESRDAQPYVNLKYLDTDYQCLSDWQPEELKALSSFVNKISGMTWHDILRSGGKGGNKTGLGYTIHKNRKSLPNNPKLDEVSPDISFFELRVTQKARVHGFRATSAFFLVWLDREHGVYKQ